MCQYQYFHAFLAPDIAQQLSLKSEGVEEEEVADGGDNKQRSRFYSARPRFTTVKRFKRD